MKSINFAQANQLLSAPENWNDAHGECGDLHVLNTGESLISCWKPSDEELLALNEGGAVLLMILGNNHPPVRVTAATIEQPLTGDGNPVDEKVSSDFKQARSSHGKTVN